MLETKRHLWLECAYDIMEKIFKELCFEGKHDAAEEAMDIMRRIILFSKKIEGGRHE